MRQTYAWHLRGGAPVRLPPPALRRPAGAPAAAAITTRGPRPITSARSCSCSCFGAGERARRGRDHRVQLGDFVGDGVCASALAMNSRTSATPIGPWPNRSSAAPSGQRSRLGAAPASRFHRMTVSAMPAPLRRHRPDELTPRGRPARTPTEPRNTRRVGLGKWQRQAGLGQDSQAGGGDGLDISCHRQAP